MPDRELLTLRVQGRVKENTLNMGLSENIAERMAEAVGENPEVSLLIEDVLRGNLNEEQFIQIIIDTLAKTLRIPSDLKNKVKDSVFSHLRETGMPEDTACAVSEAILDHEGTSLILLKVVFDELTENEAQATILKSLDRDLEGSGMAK